MLHRPRGQRVAEDFVKRLLALLVGVAFGGDIIEQHETAAPEGVSAFQGFAVQPFYFRWQIGVADCLQHDGKFLFNRKSLAFSIPHTPRGGMNNRAPAIDLGFISPLAALGASKVEWAAIAGAERIGWDHKYMV